MYAGTGTSRWKLLLASHWAGKTLNSWKILKSSCLTFRGAIIPYLNFEFSVKLFFQFGLWLYLYMNLWRNVLAFCSKLPFMINSSYIKDNISLSFHFSYSQAAQWNWLFCRIHRLSTLFLCGLLLIVLTFFYLSSLWTDVLRSVLVCICTYLLEYLCVY